MELKVSRMCVANFEQRIRLSTVFHIDVVWYHGKYLSLYLSSLGVIPNPLTPSVIRALWTSSTGKEASIE